MNPEQEKLLAAILKELVAACVREMGTAWCTNLMNQIDELKYIGKP